MVRDEGFGRRALRIVFCILFLSQENWSCPARKDCCKAKMTPIWMGIFPDCSHWCHFTCPSSLQQPFLPPCYWRTLLKRTNWHVIQTIIIFRMSGSQGSFKNEIKSLILFIGANVFSHMTAMKRKHASFLNERWEFKEPDRQIVRILSQYVRCQVWKRPSSCKVGEWPLQVTRAGKMQRSPPCGRPPFAIILSGLGSTWGS